MAQLTILPAFVSCGAASSLTMTETEMKLIDESPEVMRILSVDDGEDLAVLRTDSRDFSLWDLRTPEYKVLAEKLVKTLESTENGVGLAAPQVGINRRVVAVMRVDKEGEPIEVYPNIRIEEKRGEMEPGPEGCLSVPDARGDVMRYRDITIVYSVVNDDGMQEVREVVSGFAAVIFQHEVDHLDGVIFTDRVDLSASEQAGCGNDYLLKYGNDKDVRQLLLVRYLSGSDAELSFYVKDASGWRKMLRADAYVGKNGIGKEREGDRKTPVGDFAIGDAFGVLPNPGTKLRYIDVTPSIFACDEDTEYYNQIIDTSLVHHSCKGEDMYHCVPAYNYGIVIRYNPDNVYPLGSNIFLHCKGKAWTSGCVSMDESVMAEILKQAEQGMRVCIY